MLCRVITWLGLGSRDLYVTLRSGLQLTVTLLSLILFRPLLSAHTLRVQSVMRAMLLMQAWSLTSNPALVGPLMQREAANTMRSLGVVALELAALPLWLYWLWHYHAHWLVDYLCFVTVVAHWAGVVLTLLYLSIGARHRPAFFDTVLGWWDRKTTTPRVNKKLKTNKKQN